MMRHTDLVVVGAGLAGLTAAVRAAELGLTVTVLEQGSDLRYPCNSRYSGGIIHCCYRDVTRSENELVEAIDQATGGEADTTLAAAIAADGRRLVIWLLGQGARFVRVGADEAFRWCMAPPRPAITKLEWLGRGPDVTLARLASRLSELGSTLVLGAKASSLVMTAGVCTGVRFTRMNAESEMLAKVVLLADGGFQNDPDLIRERIGPAFEKLHQRGAGTAIGSGVRMAKAVGAAIVGHGRFYGHLLSRDALSNANVWPYPQLDVLAASGIVVDTQGKRVTDEGCGGIAIANALARQPDPLSYMAIFDARSWDSPGRTVRMPPNPLLESAGGTLYRAGSIEALAQLASLPAEVVAGTVANFNAAVTDGHLDRLNPPRTRALAAPRPISTPPFFAAPLCVGLNYTMDGLAIDSAARVLRPDRSIVEGLLAAGATTGGLEGGGRTGGYVGGLLKAGVLGLRAGETAVAAIN